MAIAKYAKNLAEVIKRPCNRNSYGKFAKEYLDERVFLEENILLSDKNNLPEVK